MEIDFRPQVVGDTRPSWDLTDAARDAHIPLPLLWHTAPDARLDGGSQRALSGLLASDPVADRPRAVGGCGASEGEGQEDDQRGEGR